MIPEKATLVLVDDDVEIIETLKSFLTASLKNVKIKAFVDGSEALEFIRKENVALVVSDVLMDGISGLQLFLSTQLIKPSVKFVIMTGYYTENLKLNLRNQGIADIVSKPFDFPKMAERIKELLQRDKKGFQGSIDGIELVDIIQMLCLSKQSKLIRISNVRGSEAKLYIKDGQIRHVSLGKLSGELAFKEIISSGRGNFAIRNYQSEPEQSIRKSWNNLILDTMTQLDQEKTEQSKEDYKSETIDIKIDDNIDDAVKKTCYQETDILIFAVFDNRRMCVLSSFDQKQSVDNKKLYEIYFSINRLFTSQVDIQISDLLAEESKDKTKENIDFLEVYEPDYIQLMKHMKSKNYYVYAVLKRDSDIEKLKACILQLTEEF